MFLVPAVCLGGSLKNIWVPLSGQIAQQRKVETIANNVANANTAAFKKDRLVFKEELAAHSEKAAQDIHLPNKDWSPQDFYHTQGAENGFVRVDGSYTIFEQGELKPTNNALDVGLKGKGMIEVMTPNGPRFTRKGNLSIDREGFLTTSNGFRLVSAEKNGDNAFISIPPGQKITISRDGDLFTKDGKFGKLSVVEFKDYHALKKEGSSFFISNASENIVRENIKSSVHQGFIEGSNVNAVSEMSELIKAHRHFENIQKAISTYDSISNKGINEVSDF